MSKIEDLFFKISVFQFYELPEVQSKIKGERKVKQIFTFTFGNFTLFFLFFSL